MLNLSKLCYLYSCNICHCKLILWHFQHYTSNGILGNVQWGLPVPQQLDGINESKDCMQRKLQHGPNERVFNILEWWFEQSSAYIFRYRTLRLEYLKRFWNGIVIVLVLVLNFESFFCDLLASVGLVNKNGCKGQH